jgi:hypothetical protein
MNYYTINAKISINYTLSNFIVLLFDPVFIMQSIFNFQVLMNRMLGCILSLVDFRKLKSDIL